MQRREFLEIVGRAGLAIMGFAVSAAANAQGQLLRNAVAIDDEFRGYCIDVYGGGANARVDEALRVHSCKSDRYRGMNGDQLFQWVDDFMGRVTMREYDRCMEVTALEPGAELYVLPCDDSELQVWGLTPSGRLSPRSRPDLCTTIAAGGRPASAPAWISLVYHAREIEIVENIAHASVCRPPGVRRTGRGWRCEDPSRCSGTRPQTPRWP